MKYIIKVVCEKWVSVEAETEDSAIEAAKDLLMSTTDFSECDSIEAEVQGISYD